MFDRRKRHRFVERNDVLVRTAVDRYQGAGLAAHTYDLSTGGARIVASKAYPVGTALRIHLRLDGLGQVVALEGDVRWTRPGAGEGLFEIGVEFRRLTSQTVLALIRHLYGRNEGIPTIVS
ncbi:MAG TPA: PilZ domain-containing protein [Candidatus Aminicenantes bacterium]|nr:PilZ domain-containing protein [Candidatus Aminicenantes bacterium]HRY64491.1 PilZ domain-containing protein [Candidatus Aminicenantes bacterium]HRZ71404.1 PilZ domain-containing protein [Candidatus Aminicenantes bacterium]